LIDDGGSCRQSGPSTDIIYSHWPCAVGSWLLPLLCALCFVLSIF
jgi:hypothetical protein